MTTGHETPPGPGHDALPEGEEQAPPGTRTMAVVRWALVGLMALAAVAAWVDHVRGGSAQEAAGAQYICPMHPQIVTPRMGECPICGMDLVPAGAAKGGGAGGAPASFTCPMHPAFVTADAAARCPDCGMKLVPVPAEPAAPAGPPVPGLAPVELTPDRVQLIGMRSVAATRETLATSLRAVGQVAARESGLVSVNARFSGWAEQLGAAQTGQLVQKDEVLASIYSPEMLSAQQVFLNAIRWSDRKPGGSAQAPPVASDLERDARLRLELLGVAPQDMDAIAQAGQPQRYVNVRSPVRGYVARRSVLKGAYVQQGTELFQLADLSTVWVLVDVYEREIPRVRVGQQATFELKAYPGRRFVGKVQFIYPALNAGSRTLQARVELRNPALELRPGMFGDVTLDLGAAEAVVVPAEALIDTGEHRYVFVDRGGGRYEPRSVEVGWSGEGRVAILSGLAAGEKVVTTANFLLDSESRLRAAVDGFGASPAAAPGHPEHAAATPAAPATAPTTAPASGGYTCPMHPAFVTSDPQARCPQCGMKLVPRSPAPPAGRAAAHPAKAAATADPHGHGSHGDMQMKMPDKAMPMPEKAMPMPEKAMPMPDKAMPMPEKAMPMPDKAMPMPEKAMPTPDKAMPMPEKAMPMPDKALPMPEKAMPMPDKAMPMPEKAMPMPDKALPMPDKAMPMPGSAPTPPPTTPKP